MDREPSISDKSVWTGFGVTSASFPLLLGSVLAAFFSATLLGGRSFFYRDYGVVGYPVIAYERACFWRGELPLWNPLSNCGAPFLGQWGTMTLYPGSIIYLILPLPWSLNFFCILHLFLGGLGTFCLVRAWTRRPLAPALAGLLFALNGVTLSCLLWPNYTVALGWMPWVLHLALQAAKRRRAHILWTAIAAALQLLAGVPELAVLTWLMVFFLALARVETRSFSSLLRLGLAVLLAAGLAAAQLLPFWQLLEHSQRDANFATDRWSLPVWGLGGFLEPLFHCFQTPEGVFFQTGQEFINSFYFGLLPLALVALALRHPRHRLVLPLFSLLVLAVFLAMGDHGFLYPALKALFPSLGVARFPVKFLLPSVFLIPALAAFGLDWLLRPQPDNASPAPKSRAFLLASAVVCGLLGLTAWRAVAHPYPFDQTARALQNALVRALFLAVGIGLLMMLIRARQPAAKSLCWLALVALFAADFATHVPWQNPSLPDGDFLPGAWTAATHLTPPQPGSGRVMISPAAEDRLLHSDIKDLESDYLGKRIALWSNLNLLDGMPKVNGSSTLQIRAQAQIQDLLYKLPRHELPRLLDFLGAAYASDSANPLEWKRRPSALPLVTAGRKLIFVPDTLAAWTQDLDPREVVWFPERLRQEIGEIPASDAKVTTLSVAPERIEIECVSTLQCVVTIAQSSYPAWKALLDGLPTPIHPANHAFQGLVVPEGRHRLVLVYADNGFRLGAAISLLTLALIGVLAWRWRNPSPTH